MQRVKDGKNICIRRLPALAIILVFLLTGCGADTDRNDDPVTVSPAAVTGNAVENADSEKTAQNGPAEKLITVEKNKWIGAYKDYIRNVDVNGGYELIYLNNDEVPEIVYQSDTTGTARTIILYSYCEDASGGYVISGYIGFDCDVPRYIPEEGYIVCQSRDYRDMDSDYICRLSGGKIHRLFKGTVFKESSPFLFSVVTEDARIEDVDSYPAYNERMKAEFNRFLDLTDCGNGRYHSEDELWEAMEEMPDTASCIYLIGDEEPEGTTDPADK